MYSLSAHRAFGECRPGPAGRNALEELLAEHRVLANPLRRCLQFFLPTYAAAWLGGRFPRAGPLLALGVASYALWALYRFGYFRVDLPAGEVLPMVASSLLFLVLGMVLAGWLFPAPSLRDGFRQLAGFSLALMETASLHSAGAPIPMVHPAALGLPIAGAAAYRLAVLVSSRGGGWLRRIVPAVALLFVAVVGARALVWSLHSVTGELDPRRLTATYRIARAKGIRSDPGRVALVEEVVGEIRRRTEPGDLLLAYDGLPMLYFLTDTRPALDVCWAVEGWRDPGEVFSRSLQRMVARGRVPELAVRCSTQAYRIGVDGRWHPRFYGSHYRTYSEGDPIAAFLARCYRREKRIGPFEILTLDRRALLEWMKTREAGVGSGGVDSTPRQTVYSKTEECLPEWTCRRNWETTNFSRRSGGGAPAGSIGRGSTPCSGTSP